MGMIPPFFANMFKGGRSDPVLAEVPMGKGEWIRQEFNKAEAYHRTDLDRENTNWKMFSGFDFGQWDDEAVTELQKQGRHIPQYNMIRDKIESLAGNLIKDFFDVSFIPVDGEYTPFTRILRELMMSDKELLDWEHSYDQVVTDGLVYRGVEQMVISDRYSRLGNVGFERCLSGTVLASPYWRTASGWDLNYLFKAAYMDAEEMMNVYDTKASVIKFELQKIANAGHEYNRSDQTDGLPFRDFSPRLGSEYRIIEYHHMRTEKQDVRYTILGDLIPDGTEEYQREWAELNGLDFDTMTFTDKLKVRKYYVTTVVPELDMLILEDKASEIQIGRLPFFFFTAAKINGRDSGIVDLLIDAQQTINKRESMIDDMIASSAKGGLLVDEDVFDNDPRAIEEYKNNSSKPGYRGTTKGGVSIKDKVYELPAAQFPTTAINEENRMVDFLDKLSKVTPAQSGRSEGSEESGVLFGRKQLQTEINQTLLRKNLSHFWNEKGEAYMLLAQQLYSDVYRRFSINNGKETIEINIPLADGSKANDISMMPRQKVVVDQSPQGATQRLVDRAMNADLVKSGNQDPLVVAVAMNNIFQTLDHNPEEREQYMKIGQVMIENALLLKKAENKGFQHQIAQADAGIRQLTGGQQGLLPDTSGQLPPVEGEVQSQ